MIEPKVADPSVTVFLDSATYGNPAGYAIGGFYFPYGSGNVEGIAFHPQEQTGESQILTSFILGNKFILTQETSRPVDPTPSPPAELPYAGR